MAPSVPSPFRGGGGGYAVWSFYTPGRASQARQFKGMKDRGQTK